MRVTCRPPQHHEWKPRYGIYAHHDLDVLFQTSLFTTDIALQSLKFTLVRPDTVDRCWPQQTLHHV